MEDRELITNALKGEQAAFSALYEKYKNKLYGYAVKELSDKEESKELVQKTFIKAFLKLNTIQEKEKFEPWLFMIFKKNRIDAFRSKRNTDDISKVALFKGVEDNGINKGELPQFAHERLKKFGYDIDTFKSFDKIILKQLGEKCQQLLKLKYLEEFSYKEISERFFFSHSEKQLKDHIYECRKKGKNKFKTARA